MKKIVMFVAVFMGMVWTDVNKVDTKIDTI